MNLLLNAKKLFSDHESEMQTCMLAKHSDLILAYTQYAKDCLEKCVIEAATNGRPSAELIVLPKNADNKFILEEVRLNLKELNSGLWFFVYDKGLLDNQYALTTHGWGK